MKLTPRKEQSGFTLIELVIYISLLFVILFAAGLFIFSLFQATAYNRAQETLLESGSGAMERLVREVHAASAIYTPTSVFSSTPGQLSIETSDNPPVGETVTYKDFFVSDEGRLCMHLEGQAIQCLTDPATIITDFHTVHLTPPVGPDAVQVFLTLRYKSDDPNLQPSYSLQTSIQLRTYYKRAEQDE